MKQNRKPGDGDHTFTTMDDVDGHVMGTEMMGTDGGESAGPERPEPARTAEDDTEGHRVGGRGYGDDANFEDHRRRFDGDPEGDGRVPSRF